MKTREEIYKEIVDRYVHNCYTPHHANIKAVQETEKEYQKQFEKPHLLSYTEGDWTELGKTEKEGAKVFVKELLDTPNETTEDLTGLTVCVGGVPKYFKVGGWSGEEASVLFKTESKITELQLMDRVATEEELIELFKTENKITELQSEGRVATEEELIELLADCRSELDTVYKGYVALDGDYVTAMETLYDNNKEIKSLKKQLKSCNNDKSVVTNDLGAAYNDYDELVEKYEMLEDSFEYTEGLWKAQCDMLDQENEKLKVTVEEVLKTNHGIKEDYFQVASELEAYKTAVGDLDDYELFLNNVNALTDNWKATFDELKECRDNCGDSDELKALKKELQTKDKMLAEAQDYNKKYRRGIDMAKEAIESHFEIVALYKERIQELEESEDGYKKLYYTSNKWLGMCEKALVDCGEDVKRLESELNGRDFNPYDLE